MKTMISVGIALSIPALFIAAPLAAGEEFVDDFGGAKLAGRQAERGQWEFQNGIAHCVADPDLYKKFKNHGPILKWPREFSDAKIQFEMKATNCQRVVLTLNGDGHIFRVTLADERPDASAGTSKVPTRIIAWAAKSSKQNKGDTIKPKSMPIAFDKANVSLNPIPHDPWTRYVENWEIRAGVFVEMPSNSEQVEP